MTARDWLLFVDVPTQSLSLAEILDWSNNAQPQKKGNGSKINIETEFSSCSHTVCNQYWTKCPDFGPPGEFMRMSVRHGLLFVDAAGLKALSRFFDWSHTEQPQKNEQVKNVRLTNCLQAVRNQKLWTK